jgi:peptidoglycan/LPS O-acetylase OafA/YrhL
VLFGAGVLAALFCFLPSAILIYFLVWLFGAALYFINMRSLLPPWFALLLFLAIFSAARLQWPKVPFLADFFVGASFALLINAAASGRRQLPWHNLSRKAADFSYSVYLCHIPFLVLILSALYQRTGIGLRGPRNNLSILLFLSVLGLTYFWCYIVSLATEHQTPRIRKMLYRFLGREMVLSTVTIREAPVDKQNLR